MKNKNPGPTYPLKKIGPIFLLSFIVFTCIFLYRFDPKISLKKSIAFTFVSRLIEYSRIYIFHKNLKSKYNERFNIFFGIIV